MFESLYVLTARAWCIYIMVVRVEIRWISQFIALTSIFTFGDLHIRDVPFYAEIGQDGASKTSIFKRTP
jgi:hypothetical protein